MPADHVADVADFIGVLFVSYIYGLLTGQDYPGPECVCECTQLCPAPTTSLSAQL